MKSILLLTSLFTFILSYGANKDMPTSGIVGVTAACSGDVFRDNGGAFNYSSNANGIYTICPSAAGNRLRFTFTAFNLELNDDMLYVYDGSSTAATLIGAYTGTTIPPVFTATTTGGCITFRFISDNNVNNSGWLATISCIPACQSITANFVSSSPASSGGIIRACQNQSITFNGSGTFSSSGVGAIYTWDFGDGTTGTGTTVNHSYSIGGSFNIKLTITDVNGCVSANFINQVVQIATIPTITTSATPSTLCTNLSSAFNANVTMQPYTTDCTIPVAGTTYLPDISGGRYHTQIPVNCYAPGATVTAASNIASVCMSMEHSFVGDLTIIIRCPDGNSANLVLGPVFNGTDLGIPIATAGTGPGTGSTYCFTPSATTLLTSGATTGGSFNPGNYRPVEPFSDLIGCPLNGNWELEIQDNLASDDGYIFSWEITFDPAILPASQSFTPTIVSQGWVAVAGPQNPLTPNTATTATVNTTNQGTPCYTYSLTDNFGCTYTAPQCITVNCGLSLPVELISFEALAESNQRVYLKWITASEINSDYFLIEHSTDGEIWEPIAHVDAAGNSVVEKHYQTIDENPYFGTSYYRLKQFDLNGSLATTDMEVVYLNNLGDADFIVFPNPSSSLITVHGDLVSLSTFEVLNMLGQNVKGLLSIYDQGDGTVVIDISALCQGVYSMKCGMKFASFIKE